ncbi:PIN domain-containing protein [Streptomyces sp. NPDC005065]|uniref:PIN domain-containing protein n=1 Tax=unclassified Streptomyces TaxID=2593676 RepID=UPI00339F9769
MLLRPGKTCDEAIKFLDTLTQQGLNDVQHSIPHVSMGFEPTFRGDRYELDEKVAHARRAYDQWTLAATTELLAVFADRSVPARMRGERYNSIVHGNFTPSRWTQLLNAELQELRTYFMELANTLRETQERYKHHQVRTVVLDTNDLLHHMRYDKIPWHTVFGKGTVVVIPHVVVDEIDKKSYAASDSVRKRARGVFALLEETLSAIEDEGRAVMTGGTVVEVLLDEPGHVRLPNNDDEIVARACYLQQAIAPTPVTVVTGDNGMRARALAWGLKARRLDEKYNIERLTAAQKDENLAAITFDVPEGRDSTAAGGTT